MRKISLGRWGQTLAGIFVIVGLVAGTGAPAGAGLIGDTLETTEDTLDAATNILTAGWDDGATTPAVPMSTVAAAIGADDLWSRGYTGKGIGVAMIDTGTVSVQGLTNGQVANGPDLSFDSQVDDLRYLDGFGHGTHMAGIIAGDDGAKRGFKGIAPHARLVNVKVGAADGAVDVSQVVAAIDWVVQHRNDNGMNIRVINLSYGTDGVQSHLLDPLSYAVEVAWRHGIVVVTGAGNDGTSHPTLVNPAYNPYVLAVGAADLKATASVADDTVAPFSSRGSSSRRVDFVAPGVSITSLRDPGSMIDQAHPGAVVDERFFRGSGTSQAAAVTSGAVALLLQARPKLTPDEVKALFKQTATPIVGAELHAQGAGRLDVDRASTSVLTLLAEQSWTKASGTGTLEGARGTSHVASDGIELTGEQDIFGTAWDGATWAPAALAGTTWDVGTWRGNTWTGDCWCGTSWTSATWTGSKWISSSWTGSKWITRSWNGSKWIGSKWIHDSWSGSKWIGASWTGDAWKAA